MMDGPARRRGDAARLSGSPQPRCRGAGRCGIMSGPAHTESRMFDAIESLPPDPILGVHAAFRRDESPHKIDLGIGVYRDQAGNTPVPAAVHEAEQAMIAAHHELTRLLGADPSSWRWADLHTASFENLTFCERPRLSGEAAPKGVGCVPTTRVQGNRDRRP